MPLEIIDSLLRGFLNLMENLVQSRSIPKRFSRKIISVPLWCGVPKWRPCDSVTRRFLPHLRICFAQLLNSSPRRSRRKWYRPYMMKRKKKSSRPRDHGLRIWPLEYSQLTDDQSFFFAYLMTKKRDFFRPSFFIRGQPFLGSDLVFLAEQKPQNYGV